MPLIAKWTLKDWYRQGVPAELQVNADGSIETLCTNLWKNQFLIELAEDDEPLHYDLSGFQEAYVGDHIWISRPGNRTPGTGVPTEETKPPKLRTRTRQTTSPIPDSQAAWVASQKLVDGISKGKRAGDIEAKPLSPKVSLVATTTRGFRSGTYGYAYGYESTTGRTTTTAVSYVTVATNNTITVTLPETHPKGAKYINLYLTTRNGGDNTLRLQRSLNVNRLRGKTEYVLNGPWRAGKKPPPNNQSGFGVQNEPHIPRDAKVIHSAHDAKAGEWRFAYQLENNRGRAPLSAVSERKNVAGDIEHYRVKEPIDSGNAEAYFQLGTSPGEHASMPDSVDPRSLLPEGKLGGSRGLGGDGGGSNGGRGGSAGDDYYGEEIDHEEGLLVSAINAIRTEHGLRLLILNRSLNRAAYRGTDPQDEGYSGVAVTLISDASPESHSHALEDLDASVYLDSHYEAVGVARDASGWTLIVGDDEEYEEAEELLCEHIGPDGSVHRHIVSSDAVAYADAGTTPQGWDCVNNARLRWSYSGSFSSAVSHASGAWNAGGQIAVGSGGGDLAIHDGSLPSNVAGRTYSDGRMYLDAGKMNSATTNCKQAITTHEFGHALGFPHETGATSVMQPGFVLNGTGNPDNPTAFDQSRYSNTWGSWGGSGGTGTGGTGTGGTFPNIQDPTGGGDPSGTPGGTPTTPEDQGPEFRWVWKTRTLSVKKHSAFHFKLPPKVRHRYGHIRWIPWVFIDDEPYRVYNRASRLGSEEQTFSEHEAVEISGAMSDAPNGQRIVLISGERPPDEDTSVVEAPDPTSLPETPVASGSTVPDPGDYLVSTTRVTDSGRETELSDPANDPTSGVPPVSVTSGNMMRIAPVRSVNLLSNAEFSEVDSNGAPADWSATNASVVASPPGTGYWIDEGVLYISTAATGSAPRLESAPIAVNSDTILQISGTLGRTTVNGTADTVGVAIVEYNGATPGTGTATITSLSTITTGLSGEKEFSVRYGGTGTAFAPDTTSVAIRPRFVSGTTSGTMYVKHLRVLPFPADVRKVEDPGSSEAPFDASPTTPVTGQSFIRVGPPPSAPADITGVDPSLGTVDFESGFPTSPWTFASSGTGMTSSVTTGAALYGTNGWNVQKTSTVSTNATATRVVSSGDRDQGTFAERYLWQPSQVATRDGTMHILYFRAAGSQLMGAIRYKRESGNHRLYLTVYKNNGDYHGETRILSGITAGSTYDIELLLTGMNTTEGTVSASVGVNGAKRSILATYKGRDFTSRNVTDSVIAFNSSNNLAKYTFKVDQIVPTKAGDVTTRETPAVPTGYTPPPPDRPVTSSVIRRFDEDGVLTGQVYAFVAPGEGPFTVPLLEEPIAVKPGLTYTVPLQSRWSVFSRDGVALVSPGLKCYLQGEGREDLFVGSAHGTGMTGEQAWSGTDNYVTFTVPLSTTDDPADTYTLFRPELVLEDGVYVFQDFGLHEGNLTTQAARDAVRGYGRATSATFSSVLDTRPPDDIGPRFGTWWAQLGVREGNHELPAGVSLAVRYSSSFDSVTYFDDSDTPEFVVPRRWAKIDGTLTSDGRYSPLIPSGGAYAETWHPIGNLLRADRSEFSGCVWVGNGLYIVEYADTEVEKIGGHFFVNELTEDVTRIFNIPIEANTEKAIKEITNRGLKDEFWIEIPHESDTVAGVAARVRFGERPDFGEARNVPSVILSGRRRVYAGATVAEAEVLEVAPLRGPLYGYIPQTADAPLPVAVG